MGKYKTEAIQVDLGKLTHIPIYSDISRNIQPGIFRFIQAYLERCRSWYIQNPFKFRTRVVFRILEEGFVKIVNMLYEINIMKFFNTRLIFTPIVFTLCEKGNQWLGAMNFYIP